MSSVPVYDLCSLAEFRHNDFLISVFAPYLKNHHKLKLPHRHNFYHMILFTQGEGSHTVDFQKFPVKAGQIYFMVPGQVHSWEFEGDVDGFVLNFSPNLFQSYLLRPDYLSQFSFFKGIAGDSVIQLPETDTQNAVKLFEEMLAIKFNANPFGIDKLRVAMLRLFLMVQEQCTHSGNALSGHNLTTLNNFQRLVDEHHATLRLPKEYAEMLFITPNHLNALTQDVLGKSAGEVIRDRVALEVKRLLINLEIPITEIAYQLNFSDNSYFTKFFKKQAGCTPEEFRKQVFKQK